MQRDGVTHYGPGFGEVEPPAPKRRRRWPLIAAAVTIVLIGAGAAAWAVTAGGAGTPATLTIDGQLDMPNADGGYNATNGDPCNLSAGFADIKAGTQITVTDEAGKVVALGRLGVPSISLTGGQPGTGYRCLTPFNIAGIPAGRPFYGLEVSHRGIVRFTPDQLRGQVRLTLGG